MVTKQVSDGARGSHPNQLAEPTVSPLSQVPPDPFPPVTHLLGTLAGALNQKGYPSSCGAAASLSLSLAGSSLENE